MKIIFKPQTEWLPPQDFPDLSKYDEIAVDLETKDPNNIYTLLDQKIITKDIKYDKTTEQAGRRESLHVF